MKTFFFSLFFLVSALVTGAAEPGYINGEWVALRVKPATYYERLAMLQRGTAVEIVSEKNGWTEILLPVQLTGWVRSDTVDGAGTVIAEPCPVYSGAGEHFNAFGMAPKASTLELTGKSDGSWLQVKAPADATGWVASEFVSKGEPQTQKTETAMVVPEAAVPGSSEAEAELARRRQALKLEHSLQEQELFEEQARLQKLKDQADALRTTAEKNSAEVAALQLEAERLDALREAAKAKAQLATVEREKALLMEQKQQEELLAQQRAAEAKARSVQEDSARWTAQAKAMEEKLAAAKEQAAARNAAAQKQAAEMAEEQAKAEQLAREASEKVRDAEARKADSLKQQQEIDGIIADLQTEVQKAASRVEMLKLSRESIEATAREETAKLAAMRAEADRIDAEKREQAAKIEQAKQDQAALAAEITASNEKLEQMRAEAEKRRQDQAELERLRQEAAQAKADGESIAREIAQLQAERDNARNRQNEAAAQLAAIKAEAAAVPVPTPDELAQPTAEPGAPAAPAPKLTILTGTILPLGNRATSEATHALCETVDGKYRAICYLGSKRLDLTEWERQFVQVSGLTRDIPTWTLKLMEVSGIVRK